MTGDGEEWSVGWRGCQIQFSLGPGQSLPGLVWEDNRRLVARSVTHTTTKRCLPVWAPADNAPIATAGNLRDRVKV